MNYNVSPSSPTDELLTLGQILSEVGDYASTILDRDHLSLSKKCCNRLNKVVEELVSRQKIDSAEGLYDMPEEEFVMNDLSCLSIGELHNLYRQWPKRHQARANAGRESHTFYFEGKIVQELKSRKAVNKGEQLKIDYCTMTYRNELENMSYLLSLPVQIDNDKIHPDRERIYTPEKLTALIRLYKNYRDVTEREILVEYVDYALDWLESNQFTTSDLGLLTEIAEISRREIICVPEWINKRLEGVISTSGREA